MSEERIFNFEKLTPIDDVELGIYAHALDKVFAEEDLKNIAISGAYSSGKSSVLESYKKVRPEKRFMHISLAHFEAFDKAGYDKQGNEKTGKISSEPAEHEEEKSDIDAIENSSIESILEGKILNQLIHQIDPVKIPQTNFRVKPKMSKLRIAFDAVFAVLSTLSLLYALFFEKWIDFVSTTGQGRLHSLLEFSVHPAARVISIIFTITFAAVFVYRFIVLQKTKNIVKRISVKGTDIEILGENKDSYFDRYLNEVLYLFDNSNSDVIVFEDMDRFNANQVFVRLREVNTLINAQRKLRHKKLMSTLLIKGIRSIVNPESQKESTKKHRKEGKLRTWINKRVPVYTPLRFFYLLRDDIFTTKDRTKFFDYIVPVVPVIDGSNSYDKFIEKFKNGGIYGKFDPRFLQKLSLYVDDMRLLLNIYNEFLIYEARINSTEQDWNKLLSMITYKNIFPRDFNELQLGKGYIHTVIAQKQNWIDKRIEILSDTIDKKRQLISEIENELCNSSKKLLLEIKGMQLVERNAYFSGYPGEVNLVKTNQEEYDRRNALITDKANGKTEEIRKEINLLLREIERIQPMKLAQLAYDDDNDEIFMITYVNPINESTSFNEVKKNSYFPLLKFLLRYGWIDESYKDYMNYFYPNSLSVEDKTFLRSITDKNAKPYNYTLKDPAKVLSYLSVFDFRQPEILNFCLMTHLLTPVIENHKYISAFFDYVSETRNYLFIIEAIECSGASKELVNKTNHAWSSFISDVISGAGFSHGETHDTAISDFVLKSLYHSPKHVFKLININNCVTEYIQNNRNYLVFGQPNDGERSKEPNIEMLVKRFDLLGVKFKALDFESSNKELFQKVYEHDQYEINKDNIWLMLKTMYGLEETIDFINRNLTVIMSKAESPLANYIWKNFEAYIEIVLTFCEGIITDDEKVVLSVLNCKEITVDIRSSYLEKLTTKITAISEVSSVNPFWKRIFEFNLCENTQENVLSYFEQYGLDNTLITFINRHEALSYEESLGTAELRESFFDAVIANNGIADDRYLMMLTSLGFCYNSFEVVNVSKAKMDILITSEIIRMTAESLSFLRENYPDNLMLYIEKGIVKYTTIMTDELFIFDEALNVLKLGVSDENKIKLLGFTNTPISVLNKGYTDAVKIHILNNNFNEGDLSGIIAKYTNESTTVKAVIERKVIAYIEDVLENEIIPPIALFDALQTNAKLTAQNKLELFALVADRLGKSQFRSYLPQLGIEYYNRLFERGQPQIPNTTAHEKILSILQRKRWISSFKIDDRDSEYFRAYGWKPHKEKNEGDEQGDSSYD